MTCMEKENSVFKELNVIGECDLEEPVGDQATSSEAEHRATLKPKVDSGIAALKKMVPQTTIEKIPMDVFLDGYERAEVGVQHSS